jgi:triosephosphate isomerase (TIM)
MTRTRTPLIAGNCKMNGLVAASMGLAAELAARATDAARAGSLKAEILLCPPATLLAEVGRLVAGSPIVTGGQDCHAETAGAFTGDISAEMLADIGCRYAIVGHSERRSLHGESDADVLAKASAALRAGLGAIVCVGETAAERDGGEALAVVERQVRGSVPSTSDAVVVAYEPIWAIGTGRTASPADIGEVHSHLRAVLKDHLGPKGNEVRILYGGSVKAGNAAAILATADVDGALVGGASLKADDFWGIVTAL